MDTQSIRSDKKRANDCVSERGTIPLTFNAVDGLAFAAEKGRLGRSQPKTFLASDIGPLLELNNLSSDGLLPAVESVVSVPLSEAGEFCAALRGSQRYWVSSSTGHRGFFRTTNNENDISTSYQFGQAAQKAAIDAGFGRQVARQLVAAIIEMVDNIYLHSKSSETGLAAFQARIGSFEFVVSDRGVGILRSLQENFEYAGLSDHGDALHLALKDGCSRFGSNSNHGHGFRPLFIGLSNLNGALRFRSGDHALTIDGTNPQSIPWAKLAKPKMSGFLASISCRTHSGK